MAVNVFDIAGTWRRGLSDPGALVGTMSVDTDTGRVSAFNLLRTGGIKENTGTTISSPTGPELVGGTPLSDTTYGLDAVTFQGIRNKWYRMETMLRGGYSMLATWQLPNASLASYTGGTVRFSFASSTSNAASNQGSGTLTPARVASAAPTDIVLSPATIAENSPVGSRVGLLTTSDPTAGDTFTYSLVPGNGATDNASFQIVGNELRANATFNFEAKSGYTVRVRTTDRGGLSFEKAVPITVTNVNEAPTDISLTGSSVAENMPAGTVLGTLSTMDPDSANSFTYTLVSGTGATDNDSFRIVGNSLQTAASFNYEARNSYTVRIRSTDQGGLLTEKSFTITVADVYEGPTTTMGFNLFDNRSSYNERIGNAVLKTEDWGGGKTVKYWTTRYSRSRATVGYTINVQSPIVEAVLIARLDTPFPGFSGATGALRVQGTVVDTCSSVYNGKTAAGYTPIDITYLVKGRTAVNVEAYLVSQVGGGQFLRSSSWETTPALQLVVTFQNNAPTDIALSPSTVAENLPSGATVGTLTTTDPDAGDACSYTLVTGTGSTDNASFQIVGNTLKTTTSFNYEAKSQYSVRIRSTDRGGLFIEKPCTITILDVNEAPTAVALANATKSLPENTTTSSRIKVADIIVTDDALGTNSLSLSGADAASFEIGGKALYLKAGTVLDFEAKAAYAVTVAVQDSTVAGSAPKTADFLFSVTDVNEAPTGLTLYNATTTLPENIDTSNRLLVADIDVFDDALGTNTLFLIGADAASFEIDDMGLWLKAGTALDFETKAAYAVTIAVQDSTVVGSSPKAVDYGVAIKDVNEAPTSLSLYNTITSLPETIDTSNPLLVADIAVVDDALGTNTFFLTGADADSFEIEDMGLWLKAGTSLDYRNKKSYAVTVQAIDSAVEGSSPIGAAFELSLTKSDTPSLGFDLLPTAVAENALPGTRVGEFKAEGLEDGDSFTYALVPGEGSSHNELFAIQGGALLTVAMFDYETQASFDIRVRATDAHGASIEKTFTIAVMDVDEPPTATLLIDATWMLSEATDTTSRIKLADIVVFDDALGVNTLAITGDDAAQFEIDESALYLKAGVSLDYETQSLYGISIGVSTNDLIPTPYMLFITDAADASPRLWLPGNGVAENMPAGTFVGMLSCDDNNTGDTCTYTLVAGSGDADNASFQIIGNGLYTAASFDFEARNSYTVRIRSAGQGGLSAEKAFAINVADVNEAPTSLTLYNATTSLSEDTDTSSPLLVADIAIVDDALGINVLFLMGDDADSFEIVDMGLYLKAGTTLNRKAKAAYAVTVAMRDVTVAGSPMTVDFILAVTNGDEGHRATWR